MDVVFTALVILVTSYIGVLAARRAKVSSVIILILIGLLIGTPVVRELVIEPNSEFVFAMGDVGLLAIMFLAGLESSWRSLYKERRDAMFIASFTAVFSFLLGFAAFLIMDFSLLVSSIAGICMSITAEATRARVLLELDKLKTRVGAAVMGAGIIDDVFGLGMFILITYILKEVYIKEDLLIAGAILMFFVGIVAQRNIGREHNLIKNSERLLLALVAPFFFISIGMHFDFTSILVGPVVLVVLFIAIAGKFIGSLMTKPFVRFKWRQLHLIGWAMNSRGAVGLALALISFRTGLIPIEMYSSLVIMAIVTTLTFPFIITWIVRREPGIMD